MIKPIEDCEEVLVGTATAIQHAMRVSELDWHPYFEGQHYQAACGARMDPDRTKFSRDMDPCLSRCQRAACMKAWKALLG